MATKVIVTRFPYESQLGGEELHTFAVVDYLAKHEIEVKFFTSCPVLRKFAHSNNYTVRKVWMFKPPVSAITLLLFTALSPVLLTWSLFNCLWLRATQGKFIFYSLSFTEKLLFAPWCFMLRIPMIWVEHARIGNWFHKNPWKFWYKLWGTDRLVTIVTVSERMKKDLGIDSVKVIPNAIETKEFSKLHDVSVLPEEVLQGFRKKDIDIGYVGRLSEDKGMELILDAAAELPEIGFNTVGSGPYKKMLENAGVTCYPHLTREQIAAFMQSIDVFVLPATKTDPFGLVVLEALAAGAPVLVTEQAGVTDYLNAGKECIVTTPDRFVEDLKKLIADKKMQEKLKEHAPAAIERFSYEEMLTKYLKLVKKL